LLLLRDNTSRKSVLDFDGLKINGERCKQATIIEDKTIGCQLSAPWFNSSPSAMQKKLIPACSEP
jgi:hypothetical protein